MDYSEIKKYIKEMESSKLDCLDLEFPDGTKISMKKNQNVLPAMQQVAPMPMPVLENRSVMAVNEPEVKKEDENLQVVTSPMVGTYYSKPNPTQDSFVKVGDRVKKGDILCIIEAMKLMNEIESEFDGEITEICLKDEDVVEYGKPLFKIK